MREYYPKKLAISKPDGKNIFEFVVQMGDRIGAYAELITVFANHRVDIRSGAVERMGESSDFLTNLFCDLSRADCTAKQLQSDITALNFVKQVEFADMSRNMMDRFMFPTTMFDGVRVILMRVEPLLNIERNLIKRFGSAGEAIMYDEGKAYAQEVMNHWRQSMPKASPEELLETVKDALRVTGWGLFDFIKLRGGFVVRVENPPMLKEEDYTENRFYYGVASSTLESIYGNPLQLTKSSFDRKTKLLEFTLERKRDSQV